MGALPASQAQSLRSGQAQFAVFGSASKLETLAADEEGNSFPASSPVTPLPSAEASGCWEGPGPTSRPSSPSAPAPFLLVPGCFPGEELRPRAHESHSVLGSAGPWLPPQLLSGKMRQGHLLSALKGPPGWGGTRRVLWGGGRRGGQRLLSVFWGAEPGPCP